MNKIRYLMVLACLCPVASVAQDAEPGGVFFTFDIGQSFEASTDRDLTTTEAEDGVDAITTLGFGAVSETRNQRLSFDISTGLRTTEDEFSTDDTTLRLGYNRNSADAIFDVSATYRRADISFLRDVSDFINADGDIVLPDDFDDLLGSGIREETTLATSLRWGETAPIGYRIGLTQRLLRYQDASTALADADTESVSAGLRLNFNEVTTGNIDISYTQTDEVGSVDEDFATFSSSVTVNRPLGDLTTRVTATRQDDGDLFWAATVNRRYELPGQTLNGTIGVVQDEASDARLTGQIDYVLPRPSGQIDVSAIRSLAAGADRATTTLRAAYLQELSPVSTIRFGVDFAQASDSDGGDVLATGSLSARYGISIAEFWDLGAGVSVDVRDDDGTRSQSENLFLTFERPFSWRP